jgi:hypothetical protein
MNTCYSNVYLTSDTSTQEVTQQSEVFRGSGLRLADYNAKARFKVAVQRFIVVRRKKNWNTFRLLVCLLRLESDSHRAELTIERLAFDFWREALTRSDCSYKFMKSSIFTAHQQERKISHMNCRKFQVRNTYRIFEITHLDGQ